MKANSLTGVLCSLLLLYVSPALADDHDDVKLLRDDDVIVSLESLIKDALMRRPGRAIEAELEHERGRYIYEIEILDHDRNVWELRYDAQDGRFLNEGVDN